MRNMILAVLMVIFVGCGGSGNKSQDTIVTESTDEGPDDVTGIWTSEWTMEFNRSCPVEVTYDGSNATFTMSAGEWVGRGFYGTITSADINYMEMHTFEDNAKPFCDDITYEGLIKFIPFYDIVEEELIWSNLQGEILAIWTYHPVIADAGSDVNAQPGDTITLDGSNSRSMEAPPISYNWSIVSGPSGSTATLIGEDTVAPVLVPDIAGDYNISLVASVSESKSSVDYVLVNVEPDFPILPFQIVDAEYSKSLDKIIAVASMPSNQLHIYDPVTEINVDIDLPFEPSCVSVSPDGYYAVVGHNGWISYINLVGEDIVKTFAVTTDVFDIVLDGNGYVHAFIKGGDWGEIRTVDIDTESETKSTGREIYEKTIAKLHPSGEVIYGADNGKSPSDIEKYSIINGTAEYLYDSPYHGTYTMCGDLWFSEDGTKIFTRCGNIFKSSAVESEDMTYEGTLSGVKFIANLEHSSVAEKIVVLSENLYHYLTSPGVENVENKIRIYDYDSFEYEKTVILPNYVNDGNLTQANGRFVFFNSTEETYYVIVEADQDLEDPYDFGVVTYSID